MFLYNRHFSKSARYSKVLINLRWLSIREWKCYYSLYITVHEMCNFQFNAELESLYAESSKYRKHVHRDNVLTKSILLEPQSSRLMHKNTNQKFSCVFWTARNEELHRSAFKGWKRYAKILMKLSQQIYCTIGDKENMHFNGAITHVYLPTAPLLVVIYS